MQLHAGLCLPRELQCSPDAHGRRCWRLRDAGIEADVRQGLRPDPSSVLCRWGQPALGGCDCTAAFLHMHTSAVAGVPAQHQAGRNGHWACSAQSLSAEPAPLCPTSCRQLGIQLHQLGEQLPIYDTALRRKADGVVDSQVER